jgi:hypothetical protein
MLELAADAHWTWHDWLDRHLIHGPIGVMGEVGDIFEGMLLGRIRNCADGDR